MTENKERPETPQELISRIQEACREGGPYIFRGTKRIFEGVKDKESDRVNSGIYRKYEHIFNENYQPVDIEKEIVDQARTHFSPNSANIEILTDLRHFDGYTTLIDFSRDLFVALFFACNGDPEKDGELIMLRTEDGAELPDIDYEKREMKISFIRPARTQLSKSRVEYQSSIFVHAPEGYIHVSPDDTLLVPRELKKELLSYLQKYHNISQNTIYNDLFGFIQNQENFETPILSLFEGIASQEAEKYEDAINHYNDAIRLKPDFSEAYNNRGIAMSSTGLHDKAISDYNEAIRLKPSTASIYYNRANAKSKSDLCKEAISDFDEAIRLKPDYAEAYNNRGSEKLRSGNYKEAISDFDEAIRLKPNHARAYNNRGVAKFRSDCHEEAINDYDEAIRLRTDLLKSYGDQCEAKRLRLELAEFYHHRGNAKFCLGRYKASISDYDETIRLNLAFFEAYHGRGMAKFKLGLHDEAISDFDETIRLKPDYAVAYFNRGVAWLKIDEIDEAQKDFERALELGREQGDQDRVAKAQEALSELHDRRSRGLS